MSKKDEKSQKQGGRYVFTARSLCYMAISVAVMTVCSWLTIPIGEIPVTLQTFAICLVGGLLGWKYAAFATLAYVLLGFIGVPVFSGFSGGAAKLLTPTGGYLIGFLVASPLIGWLAKGGFGKRILGMCAGMIVWYLFGAAWFMALTGTGLWAALLTCVFPYLLFDGVKIVLAAYLTGRLKNKIQ